MAEYSKPSASVAANSNISSKKSGSPPETQSQKIRPIPVTPQDWKLEEWRLTKSTGLSSCSQAQSCPQTSPSKWSRSDLEEMEAMILNVNVNVNVNVKRATIMSARLQKYALISFFSPE